MKRLFVISALFALGACGGTGASVRDALGVNKSAPDEFSVVSRPPLSVPPEFRLLPPTPGARARGVASAESQAESLIKSGDLDLNRNYDDLDEFMPMADTTVMPVVTGSVGSVADESFLSQAGADMADESIRDKLREEGYSAPQEVDSDYAIHRWFGAGDAPEMVEPKAESERIRENIDAGKPINEGQVETIKDAPSALDILF